MLKIILLFSLLAVAICGLPGGYSKVEVDSAGVVKASHEGAKGLSKQFSSKFHHRLYKVLKAEVQVVAGLNYRMDVVVGETNCLKNEVEYEGVDSCEFRDGVSTYKKCTVVVFRSLQGEHRLASSGCMLISKKDL